jgi:Fur family ferric uptake transcriptional regulator
MVRGDKIPYTSRMATHKKHHHGERPTLDQSLAALKSSGLKLTAPRKAILQLMTNHHGPFTAEEVHKRITRRVCDLATVYRTLTSLDEAGLVRRCEFGDGSSRFELAEAGGHHHHIVCKKCKKVEVVDECEVAGLDKLALKRGYLDVTHILEFFGTCPDCR